VLIKKICIRAVKKRRTYEAKGTGIGATAGIAGGLAFNKVKSKLIDKRVRHNEAELSKAVELFRKFRKTSGKVMVKIQESKSKFGPELFKHQMRDYSNALVGISKLQNEVLMANEAAKNFEIPKKIIDPKGMQSHLLTFIAKNINKIPKARRLI